MTEFYTNLIMNVLNTPISNEEKTEENTETVIIPIIHNEVSELSKYLNIKEQMINNKTLERIKNIILNKSNKDIHILLETNGGDMCSTKMICDTLLTYKRLNPQNKIKAYVRQSALSGGTLIALCADELYLSDYAHLGCVDPQLYGFSLNELDGNLSWDISKILQKKSKFSTELIVQILNKILENSIYKENKMVIMEKLLSSKVHGAGLTVSELEEIGIKRTDNIPENMREKFNVEKNKHDKNNTTVITKCIN